MALYGIAGASTAVAILLTASSASPAAAAATRCFTLQNTKATVANDVQVTFIQKVANPGDGINTVGKVGSGDLFAPPVYADPSSELGLKWETPAQGSGPIMIGMGGNIHVLRLDRRRSASDRQP
jgi:hypothetical protein